jgi:hypothetical protein
MALTFTQKIRNSQGDKAHRVYEITHDGSTVAVNASDLDLNYIDYAIAGDCVIPTSITGDAISRLSITGSSIAVSFANALSSGATSWLEAWGW